MNNHYYDSRKSGIFTNVNAETSFEYPDHRVSFKCTAMFAPSSDEKVIVAHLVLMSGDKQDINKVLPRTLILCEEKSIENDYSGTSPPQNKPLYLYIDHDDKKLLRRNGDDLMGEITEFSDEIISGKRILSSGDKKQIFSLDRLTGAYELHVEDSTEKILNSLSRPLNIRFKGVCEKAKNTQKF